MLDIVYESNNGIIIAGDVRNVLKEFDDNSINMVITSPPYWSLRSYSDNFDIIWDGDDNCEHNFSTSSFCSKCGAWKGSLGLEPTYQLYVSHIVDIFDEIYRVLKEDGVCWLNLGDTYISKGGPSRHFGYTDKKWKNARQIDYLEPSVFKQTLKPKCLTNIPHRVAIEMTERGWIERSEIIWERPNQMPSSSRDRFTRSHEMLFMFTKNEKYYFETQYEPYKEKMNRWGGEKLKAENKSDWDNGTGQKTYRERSMRPNKKGRIKRTVWSINTKPYKDGKHFAKFPPKLIETPILSSCPENGIVLDPFFGSGTTGEVAIKLNRRFIGIDISKTYCEDVAKNRIINAEMTMEKTNNDKK